MRHVVRVEVQLELSDGPVGQGEVGQKAEEEWGVDEGRKKREVWGRRRYLYPFLNREGT